MKLNSLTGFLGDNVVQLASEVLAWERKILSEDNLAKDVFTVGTLDSLLVQIRQSFVNSLWLLGNYLIEHRNEFEQLSGHLVHFHCQCIGQLLQVAILKIALHMIEWKQGPVHDFEISRLDFSFNFGFG